MLPSAVPASSVRFKLPVEVLNMRRNKFLALGMIIAAVGAASLCSCHARMQRKCEEGAQRARTSRSISRLSLGGVHVSKQADVADIGLTVYPGARPKQKDSDGSDKSANVNISGFGYGMKVVALEYESDDAPAKVLSFYRDQLKKYGNVLECHTFRA